MAYRKNVRNVDQQAVENVRFGSAMPFFWMNSRTRQPQSDGLKAYDVVNQRETEASSPAMDVCVVGPGGMIGNHNDRIGRHS
jgi:hypothetical protein